MDALEVERQLSASLAKLYGGAQRTLSPFDSGVGTAINRDEGSPRDIRATPNAKSPKKAPISASRSWDGKAWDEPPRGGSPVYPRRGSFRGVAAAPPALALAKRRPSAPAIMMGGRPPMPTVPEGSSTSPNRRWARLRNVSKLTFMATKR